MLCTQQSFFKAFKGKDAVLRMSQQEGVEEGSQSPREKARELFCLCQGGSAEASCRLLKSLALSLSSAFCRPGDPVYAHSLSSSQYNGCSGTIAGESLVRDGVRRWPVLLSLPDGDKKISLQAHNLEIKKLPPSSSSSPSSSSTSDKLGNMEKGSPRLVTAYRDELVVKGYLNLLSLVIDNPNMAFLNDAKHARHELLEVMCLERTMNVDNCPHAQYLIGECYEYGVNNDGNRNKSEIALKWYHLASAQDHAPALCELGYCYHNGEGVEVNQIDGVKYFEKSAEMGYTKAQYHLGIAKFYGQGAKEDVEQAVKWFMLAAEQEYVPALTFLGYCLQVGKGCSVNIEQAERCFRKASQLGDAYASAKLSSLENFYKTI